jgi:tetratricopeptide (TPR) repeat protein
MMGNCYTHMQQYQRAINAYRTSLDVQTVTYEGKYDDVQRINTIIALAGAIAKCDARDFETNAAVARARATQSAEDYLLLAKVYANRGDADSAIDAFDHGITINPNNFWVAKEYGLYLAQLGQSQRAEATLRKAYALNPQDEQVNLALRRMGVVPGPSLKDQKNLAGPVVPKGPIPEWNSEKMGFSNSPPSRSSSPPAGSQGPTVQAPRD